MELFTIDTGYFKLDGGAMFGVVPKSMWKKLNPPDEDNLCTWAMRCLLVKEGNRLILIDNGIGEKQEEKFLKHYHLHGADTLDKSLKKHGFSRNDITDVFLTHLHFDHCGGSVQWNSDRTKFEMAFPNAIYWSNKEHWDWAVNPNDREKASFLKDNILPIQESGQLKFIGHGEDLIKGFKIHCFGGHTENMMIPEIQYKGNSLFYCADLLPSSYHLPIPYVMAYDVRPLLTLKEKKEFLQVAVDKNAFLFFEHDPKVELASLSNTDKGVRIQETFQLSEI